MIGTTFRTIDDDEKISGCAENNLIGPAMALPYMR
jgi:hypothetical protein